MSEVSDVEFEERSRAFTAEFLPLLERFTGRKFEFKDEWIGDRTRDVAATNHNIEVISDLLLALLCGIMPHNDATFSSVIFALAMASGTLAERADEWMALECATNATRTPLASKGDYSVAMGSMREMMEQVIERLSEGKVH